MNNGRLKGRIYSTRTSAWIAAQVACHTHGCLSTCEITWVKGWNELQHKVGLVTILHEAGWRNLDPTHSHTRTRRWTCPRCLPEQVPVISRVLDAEYHDPFMEAGHA